MLLTQRWDIPVFWFPIPMFMAPQLEVTLASRALSILVDRLVSDGHSCKFLPHHLGGVP